MYYSKYYVPLSSVNMPIITINISPFILPLLIINHHYHDYHHYTKNANHND